MESLDRSSPRFSLRARLAVALGALVTLTALAFWLGAQSPSGAEKAIGYTELLVHAGAGDLQRVDIDGERVSAKLLGGGVASAIVPQAAQTALVAKLAEHGVGVEFAPREPAAERILGVLLPLALFASAGIVGWQVWRKRQEGHVKTVASDGHTGVTFVDVAGMDEAKGALAETVEFLRDPSKFGRLGGRAARGILLSGPPGTGKTLLARAAATEAGVPFLSTSGASFQELFVGVGASRVRKLFAEARKLAPCVVFIDEVDALGRRRGGGTDSASADSDQMLDQLLVEMDGFDPSSGIVVLASTNRPDVLDPALLRPGRFDRHVAVSLPDLRGRRQILDVHARRIVIAAGLEIEHIARATPGFSGADLARLLDEAAILAAREGADAVAWSHVERARDRVLMGDERHGVLLDAEERHATAVHEAGHVAVGLGCAHSDPVHKVSILPRGRALGVTQAMPERDRLMWRREHLEDRIAMLLGGRAAELEILGTMTAGASDDIERAWDLARRMVAEMGMSELGPVHPGRDPLATSAATLDRIEHATQELVNQQLDRARAIVRHRRASIARLVDSLLERDTLDATEIRSCFEEPMRAA